MDSTPRALSIDYKEKEKAKAKPSDDATGNPGDAGICPLYLGSGLKDHKIGVGKKKKKKFFYPQDGLQGHGRSFPTEETMKVAESSIGHHLSEEEAKKRADDEYFLRELRG
ncbi:uncharacterized protein LOC126802949 [Argentina anserina]|uniref:uncharacterized protein LOC126802949 n=1 Tax=Argentina anserina TaxID=57926 RepID=UPI0021762B58|nr:uncharacterized protein LOC126802949 [Potentilla anserina]